MALFKFRKPAAGTEPASAGASAPLSLEALRRRARNRLIGAAVLVLLGVIGFPLLFDTQPRPVVADIQIEIPDKAKAKPLTMPPVVQPSAPAVVEPSPAPTATASVAPAVATAASAAAPVASKPPVKAQPAPAPLEKRPATAPTTTAEADKARALLEGREAAASGTRFVVQVGAYSDANKLREVRQKLEGAHLKTYTQAVDTKEGQRTRVRVGPFATQAEADKAALRVKALDLPAAVLKM